MSKKIIIVGIILVSQIVLLMNSCTKDTTVIIDNTPEITKTVSFSKDIQPIFNNSCATAGCHSGKQAPNLSAATSYVALTTGGYLNTGTPNTSVVYLWLTGKEAVAMPSGATNNPSNINGLMLAWIKQGAKNN